MLWKKEALTADLTGLGVTSLTPSPGLCWEKMKGHLPSFALALELILVLSPVFSSNTILICILVDIEDLSQMTETSKRKHVIRILLFRQLIKLLSKK